MLDNDIGMALGLLAGTTFGSGIGFLLSWQSYNLVGSVALCGLLGVFAGLWYARKSRRTDQPH
ncbi:hypothetical protein [Paenibacillus sp. DMB20]|uniref:hypothetical protein n=1 Tax=Paenibacillus sp. DMB20 TaxID=1642570 RepID=UPI00062783F9|nr:hypothetical protein [Paenibacillus sp. DMB20]KKO52827.1 hypothetical protein XI25_16360 [Paenibacillus sp. DMB20]